MQCFQHKLLHCFIPFLPFYIICDKNSDYTSILCQKLHILKYDRQFFFRCDPFGDPLASRVEVLEVEPSLVRRVLALFAAAGARSLNCGDLRGRRRCTVPLCLSSIWSVRRAASLDHARLHRYSTRSDDLPRLRSTHRHTHTPVCSWTVNVGACTITFTDRGDPNLRL